jgi:hypothetical protein
MQVDMEDMNNNVVYSVELYDVYPKSVEAITLSHGQNGIVEISVNFVYRYWQSNQIIDGQLVQRQTPLGASQDPFISIPGAIGGLIGGLTNSINDAVGSVFSSGISAINGAIGGLSSSINGLTNIIPSGMLLPGHTSLIAGMTANLGYGKQTMSNIGIQLSTQAGLNINASIMGSIGNQMGQIKTMTTSTSALGTSLSLFTPSSSSSITTQLTTMNGQVNSVNASISNLQGTVNAGIASAGVSLGNLGGLAPNGLF